MGVAFVEKQMPLAALEEGELLFVKVNNISEFLNVVGWP